MDILLGIFLVILGVSVAFIGLQLFFVMLPIVGFLTGFYAGAQMIASWLGEGFLGTVTGWVVGAIVGILFAAIAWYWWYAGVLISSAALGALLFSGLGHAIGFTSGFSVSLFAIVGATAFMIVTLLLNLPVYMVMWNTALGGAAVAISGVMLLFNQIGREELEYGAAVAAIKESWFWVIAWVALAVVGVLRQLKLKEAVRLPENRWTPAPRSA